MTISNQLTPAGFNFLGGLYEACIDRGLNMAEVQSYLRSKGINKPLVTIKHEIEHVFQFPGYVATHPAPPLETYEQIDSQLFTARPARKVGSQGMPQSTSRIQQ